MGRTPAGPSRSPCSRRWQGRAPFSIYSPYERRILGALAVAFPDLGADLRTIIDRMVDLLPLLRAHYYQPAMKGSWSIKAVLPTLAPDLSYADIGEVQEGEAAQIAYWELLQPETALGRRGELIDVLRRYCTIDTLAMVTVVRTLSSFMGSSSEAVQSLATAPAAWIAQASIPRRSAEDPGRLPRTFGVWCTDGYYELSAGA